MARTADFRSAYTGSTPVKLNTNMKYLVYKITNNINGKIYIGIHKTKNENDGYMGSGVTLNKAFKKYGKENFSKTILEYHDSYEALLDRERELVTEDFVKSKYTYNATIGGYSPYCGYLGTPHHLEVCSRNMKQAHIDGKINYDTFTGKTHSKETKEKMSKSAKDVNGSENPMFGMMWISNVKEQSSKRIPKSSDIPNGWVLGRNKWK